MTPAAIPSNTFQTLAASVADRARAAGVFGAIDLAPARLRCEAKDSAAPAFYSLLPDNGRVWVLLQTADRWLSQSIEQDLVHTGDKLDELLEEEMADLGYSGSRLPFEHFRSAEKLFTFRSPLPLAGADLTSKSAADIATIALLGYEACFRRLGDMEGGDDE